MVKGHSGQKFKFDIPLILRLIADIRLGGATKSDLANKSGLGINKIDTYIEYLNKIDCIDISSDINKYVLTKFGEKVFSLRRYHHILEPLLLYKLSRREAFGGHLYYSALINDILYDIAFKIDNTIKLTTIQEMFTLKFPEVKTANKSELLRQVLNQGLSDSTTGFGKMGMVLQKGSQYEISGYIPNKLITAYIMYDNWPNTIAGLKINEIITMNCFPGRIFFMDQDLIKEQIYRLVDERILYLEQEAIEPQVRLSPSFNSEKILDRIIESCQ